MKRAPSDFDLTTSPIAWQRHAPEKARDPAEIERRRQLIPGELVLEKQQRGVRVARLTLAAITEPESMQFAWPLMNIGELNSAWYMYAAPERTVEEGVRRRRLKYPVLKDWQDANHLRAGVLNALEKGEELAANVVRLYGTESPQYERARRDFSTCVGNAALAGACVVGLKDGPIPGTRYRAQLFAREQGFLLAESRGDVALRVGSDASLAQLAESDSDLSVYIRRRAPEQAFAAFAAAQADIA